MCNMLIDMVTERAKKFYTKCPHDFCIKEIDLEYGVIVFGNIFQVVWTIEDGLFVANAGHKSGR